LSSRRSGPGREGRSHGEESGADYPRVIQPRPRVRTPRWALLLVVTIGFLLFMVGFAFADSQQPVLPVALRVTAGLAPLAVFAVGAWLILRRRRMRTIASLPAVVEWSADGRRWHNGERWHRSFSKKSAYGPPAAWGTLLAAVATLMVVYTILPSGISANWAGYVATGYSFDSAEGTWTQPHLDCSISGRGNFSVWVGLDGYLDGTVEQIGAAGECLDGREVYAIWYELAPAHPVFISSRKVSPVAGHVVTARVASAGQLFTLSIRDVTAGTAFTTIQASGSPVQKSSAEWVVEPSCRASSSASCADAPLAAFLPVNFSMCSATAWVNGVRVSRQLGDWPHSEIVLADVTSPRASARPSRLTDGSFSVSWARL
jgi:hypothetical protein